MFKIYSLTGLVVVVIITILVSFISGIFWEKNASDNKEIKVDSIVILNKIEDEALLITKVLYTNQESKIVIDQGSDWSNFWWGQTINTKALMKVNVGVDFKKIKESDIKVNNANKTIEITLPEAEIIATSIEGDINVTSQSGIFKWIFDNNTNKDYNLALAQLTKDANDSVNKNAELLKEAKEDSIKILKIVLKDTGYEVKIVEQIPAN